MSDDKLCPRSGEPLPQRRHDDKDTRAGMAAVEIHISGTAERLGLVEAQAERLEELERIFRKYIVHVADCEGIDFIEEEYHGPHPDHFTPDEYDKLKAFAKAAWAEAAGQAELGL